MRPMSMAVAHLFPAPVVRQFSSTLWALRHGAPQLGRGFQETEGVEAGLGKGVGLGRADFKTNADYWRNSPVVLLVFREKTTKMLGEVDVLGMR